MAVKGKQQNRVALGFDDMSQGLPDDIDGKIIKAVFAPTNYGGKMEHYALAVLLTIQPDDGNEFTQIYSVGDLQFFAPSQDGIEPVDLEDGEGEDLEGHFVVPTGDRRQLSNQSNFAFFIKHLEALGFEAHKETGSLESLEGVYGHFNQIELPKRSGIVVQEGKARGPKTILCLTELKKAPKATKETTGKAAVTAKSKANGKVRDEEEEAEESGDGIESRIGEIIVEALSEADDNMLPKSKLVSLVVKSFKDAKEKAQAVKIVADDKFLLSGDYGFSYDKKAATVSLG